MLTTEQKSVIEYFAGNTNYGSYDLARRITRREFNLGKNNDMVMGITATYYSVLNVIRRYRHRKAVLV